MKKCLALLLTLICLITLVACDVNTTDPIKQLPDEPLQIAGVIVEVYDGKYLIEVEAGTGTQWHFADGTQISVSRNVENDPNCSVGDRIMVTFDGIFQETYPLGIKSPIEIVELDLSFADETGN